MGKGLGQDPSHALKPLSEQLRAFMAAHGLNPTQMAGRVGTSRQNINNILDGTSKLPKCLPGLARAMGTTEGALLAGGEPTTVAPWPFAWITPQAWAELTDRERGAAEQAAMTAVRSVLEKRQKV